MCGRELHIHVSPSQRLICVLQSLSVCLTFCLSLFEVREKEREREADGN